LEDKKLDCITLSCWLRGDKVFLLTVSRAIWHKLL